MAKWSSRINLEHSSPCYFGQCPASTPALQWLPKKKNIKGVSISSCLAVSRSVSWELGAAAEQRAQQEVEMEEEGVVCEGCNGRGWLLCDFCKGKKNNVKSESSRIYRRCPTCKAAGYVLCSKCRVYKCITFPDSSDGEL